jgi:multiple sugar transport system permease protein
MSFKGIGFVLPVVLFLLLFVTYPFVTNFVLMFTDSDGSFVGLSNMKAVFADRRATQSIWISALYVAGSVIGQMLLGTLVGVLLNREMRGRGVIRSVVLIPWIVPGAVAATTWAWMYHSDFGIIKHLINTAGISMQRGPLIIPGLVLPALILVNVWKMFPFVAVMVLAGMKGIDPHLFEAAEVDGATAVQRLRHVTIPQLRPILLTLLLLLTIWGFNSITLIYTMTAGGPADLSLIMPIHIYEMLFRFFQVNQAAAESVVLFFIVLVLIVAYVSTLSDRGAEQ